MCFLSGGAREDNPFLTGDAIGRRVEINAFKMAENARATRGFYSEKKKDKR